MIIEILRETTGTVDGFTYPPHFYFVDKKSGKLKGYHPAPYKYTDIQIFEKCKMFDKRYRKFEKIGETEI